MRTEHLLAVTSKERENQVGRLVTRLGPDARRFLYEEFNEDLMTETINEWRNHPRTWMDRDSLCWVEKLEGQDYHHHVRSKFSTMQLHLYGNKKLVDLCLRFPICSASQPAALLARFAFHWQIQDAKRARQNPMPRATPRIPRLSQQIHILSKREKHGRQIADSVKDNWNNWYSLTSPQQSLLAEYETGNIAREIDALRSQQQPRSPGDAQRMYDTARRAGPFESGCPTS